jgi:exopolyphosphatase/pppGpp-phosphohydrolase
VSKKAVIDIGSLKTKFAIFDAQKKEFVSSDSFLTLLGKGITEHSVISQESLGKLEGSLRDIAAALRRDSIVDVSIIGTEALRKAKNVTEVQTLIERYYPDHTLEVIDQDKEAELFFTAVSSNFPDQTIAAMDIGGGSVQIIQGKYDSKKRTSTIKKKYNLSTGTYKLQQQYSPDNTVISKELGKAKQHIASVYSAIDETAPILVFGSTCMCDFITATGIKTEINKNNVKHPISVERKDLLCLLDQLGKFAPDNRSHFYPEGGYFIYGADYLLLNVLEAIDRLQPRKTYPTNLNSSYALIYEVKNIIK